MTIRSFSDHQPKLGERVFIDSTAVVIGQVDLADDVSVWPMTVIRGDVNSIRIGAQSNIQDNCVLHVTHVGPYTADGGALNMGDMVTVGHGAILHACTIGDSCLVGMGARILDKAVMQPYSMLGAGSLLTPGKVIPSGELWVGNPAVKLRDLSTEEKQSLDYSASHYVKLKDQYLSSQTDKG
ncbi:gamma carbonic anhydrase family protein [Marinicella gelatinilytica]|uniref:gamma carbonic anhydrase family protein n=1 Tax=Marinicella gelatinilytica TaxID=2996017 RepID=UPI002260E62F|nr:gamma carbonic anhydrase family protein [Marinicella gelatinilytica]MCX7544547.1 gamma carbonic anhydrase family protein [Marinicella gelatinilytica]